MSKKIAIIGAGLAGSIIASRLSEKHDVTIYEKSRGTGGRMSSCRLDNDCADLGAPCFYPSSNEFKRWLEKQSVITSWTHKVCDFDGRSTFNQQSYIALKRQSSLTRYLCNKVKLVTNCKIGSLWPEKENGSKQVVVRDDNSDIVNYFDNVIVTAPAQQASRLLEAIPRFVQTANQAETQPCWVSVIKVKGESDCADLFTGVHPTLYRCIRDSSKPGKEKQSGTETWVVEANSHWSSIHLNHETQFIQAELLKQLSKLIERQPDVITQRTHRWLLARHQSKTHEAFLWDEDTGIGACGDWLSHNSLEGSWLSANALAEKLL